jgi:hypothetical protein
MVEIERRQGRILPLPRLGVPLGFGRMCRLYRWPPRTDDDGLDQHSANGFGRGL